MNFQGVQLAVPWSLVYEAGWKRTPKSFELVKIRAKSPKIRAKCEEIAKNVQIFAKLLYVRLFYKNGTQNDSEDVFWRLCFNLVFLEVSWVKFGQKWWLKCLAPSEVQSFNLLGGKNS